MWTIFICRSWAGVAPPWIPDTGGTPGQLSGSQAPRPPGPPPTGVPASNAPLAINDHQGSDQLISHYLLLWAAVDSPPQDLGSRPAKSCVPFPNVLLPAR